MRVHTSTSHYFDAYFQPCLDLLYCDAEFHCIWIMARFLFQANTFVCMTLFVREVAIHLFSDVSYFQQHFYWRRLVVSTLPFEDATEKYWAGANGERWIANEVSTSRFISILSLEELSLDQPIPSFNRLRKLHPVFSLPWQSQLAPPSFTVQRLVGMHHQR